MQLDALFLCKFFMFYSADVFPNAIDKVIQDDIKNTSCFHKMQLYLSSIKLVLMQNIYEIHSSHIPTTLAKERVVYKLHLIC